ncbi:SWR1 complex bromodomain subunit bdf1 [Euphorbia lathyris]|uniref:SWR1 complex bromodomain subunit bdf1 n=1 Tax=Euphorbia lathyris TaxID=212925 RepID=UPI0033133BD3
MKRKRRNKKGKKKGGPNAAVTEEAAVKLVNLEREDDSGADEYDDGDDNNNNDDYDDDNENEDEDEDKDKNKEQQYESVMEVDTPSSTGTDQPLNLASIKPDGLIDKTAEKSIGRVKVKLKTSKPLESQSDTDKSSLQMGLEKQGVAIDKMEDTGNSASEVKAGVFGTGSKKPGSIKIKSSKVLGGSTVEKCSNTVMAQDEILQQKEPRTPPQESQYNKQELDSSLSVIKKVMKMDAAEPFNVPVNPEALGIPDYFDVIHTPMDFGTVCSNLEKGDKYMNSVDVYKDVQFIWDNCYKYNNKGDYILDLMRRVKKNFMKYWTAAGLFTEQSRGSSGGEGTQGDDAGASGQGHGKSSQLKQKKKKGHGRRHKFDCLCAICVLKRRRREREENARLAKGGVMDSKLAHDLKQEGSLLIESPGGEDSISNMDESLDQEADAEVEGEETKLEETEQQYSSGKEKYEEPDKEDDEEEEEEENNEMEIEIQKKGKAETSENVETGNRSGERIQQSQLGLTEDTGAVFQTHTQKGDVIEEETAEVHRNMHKESKERLQKAKMYEKFRSENPLLLNLCQTLFPGDNRRSLWSGPQSLFQQQGSVETSSIHATIETLMK